LGPGRHGQSRAISAHLPRYEVDYFSVPIAEGSRGRHRLVLRTTGWAGFSVLNATIWDEQERELATGQSEPDQTMSLALAPASAYLVRAFSSHLSPSDFRKYELVVQPDG